MPNAQVQSYTKETVVAEKLQAAVVLGIRNSRMKDFFDLLWLSRLFPFDGETLVKAIQATFERRKTDLPAKRPLPLTEGFASDTLSSPVIYLAGLFLCLQLLFQIIKPNT